MKSARRINLFYLSSLFFILNLIFVWFGTYTHCFYSTKTAYNDSFTESQFDHLTQHENYRINNCEPEQIYIFLRHGARFPNTKQVARSRNFLDEVVNYLDEHSKHHLEEANLLKSTRLTFQDKPHYALSELGEIEMSQIAKRYFKRFESIFNQSDLQIDNMEQVLHSLNVQSSSKERSIDSAMSFLRGIFTATHDDTDIVEDKLKILFSNIIINNTMLRLFGECSRYLTEIEDNQNSLAELYKYKSGKEMLELVEKFKQRHKLEGLDTINPSTLIKLFTLCNIEHAHRMPENWCRLFHVDDYETLAYYNDLKGFWKKAYGHEINSKMAFPIIKDVFHEMEKFIQNKPDKRKVLLRFGHAENMFPLVTALGLFRNERELKADNFKENLDRRFRSGRLTPFSANAAFVLHRCQDLQDERTDSNRNKDVPVYEKYKISVLINELPISKLINAGELKCAQKNDHLKKDYGSLCDYNDLKQHLSDYIDKSYGQVCDLNKKPEETTHFEL